MSTPQNQLLIGQLARVAGVKPDTIRFYERTGMMSKPRRSESGYRIYAVADQQRLLFIRKAQALGFSLEEIRRILGLSGHGKTTCRCVLGIAEATLEQTEVKLRELQRFRDGLANNVERWRGAAEDGGNAAAEFCKLIESSEPPGISAPPSAALPPVLINSASPTRPHLKIPARPIRRPAVYRV